jgi:uncharacterized membrane protein
MTPTDLYHITYAELVAVAAVVAICGYARRWWSLLVAVSYLTSLIAPIVGLFRVSSEATSYIRCLVALYVGIAIFRSRAAGAEPKGSWVDY